MSVWDILTKTWQWEPSVVLGCLSLLGGYLLVMNFRPSRRWVWFITGDLLLLVALISPLHTLGDTYLFSMHMAQHLLLLLAVPPLLLMGVPPKIWRQLLKFPVMNRIERVLGSPFLGWVLGVGVMWLWHLPALYDLTLQDHNVHIIEHLSFLVSATIFWWPVMTSLTERRMKPLPAILYLFASGLAGIVLGIIITFAPLLYKGYVHPADTLGLLPTIRNNWKFTAEMDQQVGGLLMWIVSGPFYLVAIFWVMAGWFRDTDAQVALQYRAELAQIAANKAIATQSKAESSTAGAILTEEG